MSPKKVLKPGLELAVAAEIWLPMLFNAKLDGVSAKLRIH